MAEVITMHPSGTKNSCPALYRLLAYLLLLILDLRCFASSFVTRPSVFRITKQSYDPQSTSSDHRPQYPYHGQQQQRCSSSWDAVRTTLSARNRAAKHQDLLEDRWFPRAPPTVDDDDIYATINDDDYDTTELETKSLKLMASLINQRLQEVESLQQQSSSSSSSSSATINENEPYTNTELARRNANLAKGRFLDLTCTEQGQRTLEQLFELEDAAIETNMEVIQGAVMALQSLLIYGTQVGVKGSPAQLQRMIAHLDSRGDEEKFLLRDLQTWDTDSVRRLKYRLDQAPAVQLLSELKWKRTSQGAFDILVSMGAWQKHEDLPLLRSGFSLRFNEKELEAAENASTMTRDPDEMLGLRKDLRHLKVFTIDSADTSEIDDGISLEKYTGEDGMEKQRIWVHIADADLWAPRSSELLDIARRRVTSLYLPQGAIPMLPPKASEDLMSLKANRDACALSMGIELLEDGAIDPSSIVLCPSLIRVMYRLTYEEVDEMLEEGIGHKEEWELGGLLSLATRRRIYRIKNGSSEGFIPNPIPQNTISISQDESSQDGVSIAVDVSVSHNAGKNQTVGAEASDASVNLASSLAQPVSSAFVLVTETMILAGEAIGRWKILQDEPLKENVSSNTENAFRNAIRLPFRTQKKPDYNSRADEKHIMTSLIEYNVGGGYCQAWYSRRFLSQVKVMEIPAPHSGLGLATYVQWSSPIRRYSDLLVHISVKRYLRRNRVQELIQEGKSADDLKFLTFDDLGCPPPTTGDSENMPCVEWDTSTLDGDIDYSEGGGLIGAARMLQRQSEQYWLFEYIRRSFEKDPEKTYDALVLGYVGGGDNKKQFAIYIYELGFEYRYSSPVNLKPGLELKLRVSTIAPRTGQLTFVRTNA